METNSTNRRSTSQAGGAGLEVKRVLDVVRPEPLRRRMMFRVAVLMTVVACTLAAWLIFRQVEEQRVQRSLEKLRDNLESRWAETNLKSLQQVRQICDDLDAARLVSRSQFLTRGESIRKSSDVYEALFWIGRDSQVLAQTMAEGVGPADVLPHDAEASLWHQLNKLSAQNGPVAGPTYEGSFGKSLVLLYFPLGDRGAEGGVAAIIRLGPFMEHFAGGELRDLVTLDLVHDGQLIYRMGNYIVEPDPKLRTVSRLRMLDRIWLCQIMPNPAFIQQARSSRPTVVLGIGAGGCLIAAAMLLQSLKRKWQYRILERGHLQVIEIISELTRTTAVRRGEWQRCLAGVLESARQMTDSIAVGIYHFSPDRQNLNLLGAVGPGVFESVVEMTEPATDALRAVLEGKLMPVSSRSLESLLAMHIFDRGELNSGVVAPLQMDRVLGVMVFGAGTGEPWTGGRVSLVKLWASQAAALLADEAVHQQMRDALAVQEKLAQRREMMLTVLGEIYQAGSTEGTLAHIAQMSPRALGVDACVVALRTRRDNELEIVAATGELGVRLFGRRILLTGEQIVKISKPGSVAVIEPQDVQRSGLGMLAESWLAGLAVIPMTHSDGRPIGCMVLLSSSQHAFTDDQLDLARVLASRASAAIENARLNQQIRRDAESRSMLLRELNHRVKNNLAGIVGLLSMSSSMEMPESVRQWLDRVTERIGNIARAHELFAGGITSVSIAQLVEQVIPSLAVVKPPGVTIVKELGEKELWIKTTQAVSLAMVIHEVCYNAIVHGLGAAGTLTIRAALSDERNVVLEVMDDGTAGIPVTNDDGSVATRPPPASSTGLGLRLVKGLVGRELRGRFVMSRRSEGGTIVTVEFPLERERDEGDVIR